MTARHRLQQVRSMGVSGALVPWLPAAVGVGIMVGFLVYGIALQGGEEPSYEVPIDVGHALSPPPTQSAPPTAPPATDEPTEPPATTPPATEPPPPPPPPPAHPPPPPPDVVGEYRLKTTFQDSFVGKVVITNGSHHAQDWIVKLEFPDDVGELIAFWIDGDQQPELHVFDDTHVFTSTDPVAAQSHVVLKVQFARSGRDIDPELCKVNGTRCRV